MAELDKVTEQILEQISGGSNRKAPTIFARTEFPSVMETVNM